MSASITVTDDHPSFSAIVALLTGASPAALAAPAMSPPVAQPMPAPVAQPIPAMPSPVSAPVGGDDGDDGPANTNAPATDVNGLPWDERIHAKTKATNGDGSWRYRRGVDDAVKAAVEAELRARSAPPMPAPVAQPVPMPVAPPIPAPVPMPVPAPVAAPLPPAVAPIPPAMPAPVGMEHGAVGAAPAYSSPPMPAPVASPPPMPETIAPVPVAQPGTLDFAQFMQHLSGQMTKRDGAGAPLVHADYLASITAEISAAFQLPTPLTAITDIATDPNKITYAIQLMQRDGRW